MALQTWQVGLDIQNSQLYAFAVQSGRHGGQRHHWHSRLPENTLHNGVLCRSAGLIAVLQQWRKSLPRRYSLRVGFPPQNVIQRQISLPKTEINEPELSRYATAAARRLFPISPENLVLDYRIFSENTVQLSITAAQREVVDGWLKVLDEAGLTPRVLEITPSALVWLANAFLPQPGAALLYVLREQWLWCVNDNRQIRSGWSEPEETDNVRAFCQQQFPQATMVWCGAAVQRRWPADVKQLDSWPFFHRWQPNQPEFPGAFAIAAGLALRPEDCL